jgi:hypothetical protein
MEYRFVILIPGRDTEKLLDEYRAALFAKGFYGAYSFPLAAPLAELSSPFNRNELKELAGNIRKLSMAHGGKISGTGTSVNNGFGELSFFGPLLNISITEELFPETARDKIIPSVPGRSFLPQVLCVSLVHSGENPLPIEGPALSFRAAALANLAIRSLSGAAGEALPYSFEWKMGEPVWLPVYKKAEAKK